MTTTCPTEAGRARSTRYTIASFHAHPDDEALLTGGLLARLAAAGHRVVLVTATTGERGLAGAEHGVGTGLGSTRTQELAASAEVLGCARVVVLGYRDSGLEPGDDPTCFAQLDPGTCAQRLAEVLREERADVLTVYDPNGGYGHPDHVQVYRVGVLAARLAGTPVVLEATVPGGLFTWVLRTMRVLHHPLGSSAPLGTRGVFTPGRRITHRVWTGGVAGRKRAAMAAHASQRHGGDRRRFIDRVVTLPLPLFKLAFGFEWYVEQGRPGPSRLDDVFATLRTPTRDTWPRARTASPRGARQR